MESATTTELEPRNLRGRGPNVAGQSGDVMGLSREPSSSTESVEELVEEGQDLEADFLSGVEDAPDADHGPVRTHADFDDED